VGSRKDSDMKVFSFRKFQASGPVSRPSEVFFLALNGRSVIWMPGVLSFFLRVGHAQGFPMIFNLAVSVAGL
jgi:hypothetical protein